MKTVAICDIKPKERYDELWACNNWYQRYPQSVSKLFIFHKQVMVKDKPHFDWEDINRQSEKYGFEIILQHDVPEIKRYTKYPLDKILKRFNTRYFCTSMDYMIAYAIYKRFNKIIMDFKFTLLDVDFTDSLWEKAGVEYWLGRAQGEGIEVQTVGKSNIFQTRTGEMYAING